MDGFSFAILNIPEKKYIALNSYDIQDCSDYNQLAEIIEQIIRNEELLQQDFASCSASIGNQLNTLTPKALFNEDNSRDILAFNQPLLKNEDAHSDLLSSIQAYNTYTLPAELERCFSKHFPNCKWKHDSTILIESLLRQYKHQTDKRIHLCIQDRYFEMLVLDGKKLLFYNSYNYKAAADLIYYTLFAIEQLGLNPDKIPLMIAGEIEENAEIYKLLYKYIRHIHFIPRNPNYSYSFVLDTVKTQYYYKLLNQHLCVS